MVEIFRNWLSKFIEFDSFSNKIYNQCKDVIIKPKRKFVYYKNNSDYYIPDLHIFYDSVIQWSDLDYKTKFGDYRFEWLPYFAIRIFGWNFVWYWESPDGSNHRYYEFILNYLYKYNKNIQETLDKNKWQRWENDNWVDIDSSIYLKKKL